MAPRQFGKANTRTPVGGRNADSGHYLLRPQRGLEQALEESIRFHLALAIGAGNVDLAVKRQHTGRQLRCRVSESDGTTESAAVADGGMAYMRHGECDQRRVLGNDV